MGHHQDAQESLGWEAAGRMHTGFSKHFSDPLYCLWFIYLKQQNFRCSTENLHFPNSCLWGGWKGHREKPDESSDGFAYCWKNNWEASLNLVLPSTENYKYILIFHLTRAHFQRSVKQNTCALKNKESFKYLYQFTPGKAKKIGFLSKLGFLL